MDIPQNHRADAFVTLCNNCGLPEHTSDKSSLLHNEAKITKAKEACAQSIAEGHASGSGGHGCGCGCGRGGKGGCGGDHTNTQYLKKMGMK